MKRTKRRQARMRNGNSGSNRDATPRGDAVAEPTEAAAFSLDDQLDRIREQLSGAMTSEAADADDSIAAADDTAVAVADEATAETAPDVKIDADERVAVFRELLAEELQAFGHTLRDDVRQMIQSFTEAQAAAAASQSEVIRQLTSTMIQTSSGGGGHSHDLQSQFEDLRRELCHSICDFLKEEGPAGPAAKESCATPEPAERKQSAPAKSPGNSGSSWAQIRDSFLNGDLPLDTIAEEPAEPADAAEVTQLTETTTFTLGETELNLDVTELGDVQTMSEEDLRRALIERDSLVSSLVSRLRRLKDSSTSVLSAAQLEEMHQQLPEELWNRVSETLNRMDEQIRLGELELSLERARLSRQRAEMEDSRRSLESQARQMGLEKRDDGTFAVDRNDGHRKQPRRWLGRLGFGE